MDTAQRALVTQANASVTMATACSWAGMDVGGGSVPRGLKVHCPFEDVYHADDEPAFRIYDRDAWCFACSQFWTPVSLLAEVWQVSRPDAARLILERAGVRELSYREAWEAAHDTREPDRGSLAEALSLYCSRVASPAAWEQLRHVQPAQGALASCLYLLPLVADDSGGLEWLETCKTVMAGVLAGPGTPEGG